MIRSSLLFLLTFVAASSLGCGGYTHETVNVSGVVRMEGKPIPFVEVAFESESHPNAFGITDENGYYELGTRRYGLGAVPGSYMLKIHPVPASANNGNGTTVDIPEVYSRSGYQTVTIDATKSQSTIDVELSSKPPKSKIKAEDAGDSVTEAE
ncbi:hypothetical protein [Blastopirellula marina]|uniref:Carboxypeptidase regulatory-like domain-containing protein n=1 Tax=Blastopirellula marina TaxID=124 RepID=A0A2S8F8A5_9BACT|nr:hypothetical protein [Blastopirellula marina]PQO28375.1 hypothetical protein C5Y98_26140 [Blastopirellula marina]PTL41915.1 hypothetical protein C5Y97_26155 [Blastopirellula marina]